MKTKALFTAVLGLTIFTAAQAAPNGPSATAVVDRDGTLARGLRATGATRLVAGRYEVLFDANVSLCSYTATVGLSGAVGSSDPGIVTVAPRSGKPKGVFVQTFSSRGGRQDRGFHLIVQC